MPRLNTIDPATASGTVREIFDGPLKGMHINLFKALGNAPSGLKAYLGLAGALEDSELSAAEKEAAALALAEANSCDYCLAAHTKIGTGAGLSLDDTVSIRKGDATGNDRIDAIATLVRALHTKNGFLDDGDLDAFKNAGFTDAQIVDVLVLYTLNTLTNYANHVNQTEVDFPAVPELV